MANWPDMQFETTDLDIVNEIHRGAVVDFFYDEARAFGWCRVQHGLGSLDLNEIAEIAIAHKSSFKMVTHDLYADRIQNWEFKDGIEIVAETKYGEIWSNVKEEEDVNA